MALWYYVKNVTKWYQYNSETVIVRQWLPFLQYLQDALIHQNTKISLWNYQVTYYWDVFPCAKNTFEFFELTSQFLPKCSTTLRVQRFPVLTPAVTFIAHWCMNGKLLKCLLFSYKIISIIRVLLRVCASSVTIHTIPAASWCVPCMAVMSRWQTATKCWLQT